MNSIVTLTISEFEKLLLSKDWTHNSEVYVLNICVNIIEDDDCQVSTVTCVNGYGLVESRLGSITVVHNESYNYIIGDKESFQTISQGLDVSWVIVVDENDMEIELDSVNFPRAFSLIDYELVKSGI